jgi:hypothetical protein
MRLDVGERKEVAGHRSPALPDGVYPFLSGAPGLNIGSKLPDGTLRCTGALLYIVDSAVDLRKCSQVTEECDLGTWKWNQRELQLSWY